MRRLIKRLFSKKEYKSVSEQRMIRQCLMTTMLAVAGLATLSVSTWALFSEEVFLGTYEAELATYRLTITQDGQELEDDTAYLSVGKRSKFVVKAEGTAQTGYCYVMIDGGEYVTEQLKPGDSLTFYVKARGEEVEAEETADTASSSNASRVRNASDDEEDTDDHESDFEITFIPQWGISPYEESRALMSIEEESEDDAEEQEYLISDGDTLYCGEEVEKVAEIPATAVGTQLNQAAAGTTLGEAAAQETAAAEVQTDTGALQETTDSVLQPGDTDVTESQAADEIQDISGEESSEDTAETAENQESADIDTTDSANEAADENEDAAEENEDAAEENDASSDEQSPEDSVTADEAELEESEQNEEVDTAEPMNEASDVTAENEES